ncbi:hypothetical protein D3C85_1157420 [compost metagenome]
MVRGRGDRFEIAQRIKGVKFLARGIDEIKSKSPEKGQRLTEGLEIASQWSTKAANALEMPTVDEWVKKLVSIVFVGDVPVSVLLPKIRLMDSAIKEYATGKRDIIMFKSRSNAELAHTTPIDPHRRIFISEDLLDESPDKVAWSIYHEGTHFKTLDDKVGLNSLDFAYLDFRKVVVDESASDQKMMKRELLEAHIARQSVESLSKGKREKFFKTSKEEGIREALSKSPDLTTNVLLNNADSYAMLVASIGLR